jgi:putative membrane-bound dehydrogenase-like protein
MLAIICFASVSLVSRADEFPKPFDTEPNNPLPMSATEAAKTAKLPPGFRLEVFAAEPDVLQPIAMCFDNRKRLWVAECFTYAEQPTRWNLDLRDRITILEDQNGDGRCDTRKVFWDQGQRLTSVAWGSDGVYALCPPQLMFIPDADHDDVPDAKPLVVLDGFDSENIGHNAVNGLKWGPDGWLYGRHGITATSIVGTPGTPENERVQLNCSIWRYHPTRKQFEVFCHGGTNPWGLDWDADGQLFYTNTVIGHLWHAIPGAYYERMFGAHLNPLIYEIITHTADHYHWDIGAEKWSDIRNGVTARTLDLGGGHAHMGCVIYQGGVWPEEYHGKLFTANLHGRRINMDALERVGCGYVAHHAPDFLKMEDPFFRALDLITGPDGQVWINDWSDTGECHDNSGIHRSSGRIYRIVYDGPDAGKPTFDRPAWLLRRGRESLTHDDLHKLLHDQDEAKRAMGVRWLSEDWASGKDTLAKLKSLAKDEPSGLVRLEVAAAIQRLPLDQRMDLASVLATNVLDTEDRQQPLMIWYGIAGAVSQYPEQAINLAFTTSMPRIRRFVARRLSEGLDGAPDAVAMLLDQAQTQQDSNVRDDILQGMADGLRGWSQAKAPANWTTFSELIQQHGTDAQRTQIRDLAVVFGDGRAREELLAIASDEKAEAGARRAAVRGLVKQPNDQLFEQLKQWLNDKIVSRQAVEGLAMFDEPEIANRLVNHWKRQTQDREAVIDTLVSRLSHAKSLLKAVSEVEIPRDAISPFQARQIYDLGDASLRTQLRELWGEVRETPEVKQQEMTKWKSLLTDQRLAHANLANGREVYKKTCAACHRLYDEGGAIGPNLTGSDRANLDYLLGNMIDPGAIIPAAYRMTLFVMHDGRVISGVVVGQNDRSILVQTQREQVALDRNQIDQQKVSDTSLMPGGQLAALDEDSVRDLIAYLRRGATK